MNNQQRCHSCGAPKQSSIHATDHHNTEIKMASHEYVVSAKEAILLILQKELNYYERDDKDHFFYLAEAEDLERAAELISRLPRLK